jgi:hypothetical protein
MIAFLGTRRSLQIHTRLIALPSKSMQGQSTVRSHRSWHCDTFLQVIYQMIIHYNTLIHSHRTQSSRHTSISIYLQASRPTSWSQVFRHSIGISCFGVPTKCRHFPPVPLNRTWTYRVPKFISRCSEATGHESRKPLVQVMFG